MVTKTTAEMDLRCNECGTYEITCKGCGSYFRRSQIIICDDEPFNNESSHNHYCLRCYKKSLLK